MKKLISILTVIIVLGAVTYLSAGPMFFPNLTDTIAGYLSTVSSNIQDQVDLKAPIANATMTGTFQVPSLKGTALSAVPGSPVDGVMYLFTNSSDGGADDPSDVTGTVPYWTIYDLTTTSYIALWDYDGNLLVNKTQTRTPVSGSTAAFLATFTGGNLYGGTYIATSDDGDSVLPVMAEGMNFKYIVKGAIEAVIDPNAADDTTVDGVDNAVGHALTSTSTAGDWAEFQYRDADGWLVKTNAWTLE